VLSAAHLGLGAGGSALRDGHGVILCEVLLKKSLNSRF
jgi:hypothetical protein